MPRRIKIVEIGELVTQSIADAAIRFTDLVDSLFADDDVVAIILGSDPQADHISAILLYVGLSRLRFFVTTLALLALGDFFTISIDHETVGQHSLKWRRTVTSE